MEIPYNFIETATVSKHDYFSEYIIQLNTSESKKLSGRLYFEKEKQNIDQKPLLIETENDYFKYTLNNGIFDQIPERWKVNHNGLHYNKKFKFHYLSIPCRLSGSCPGIDIFTNIYFNFLHCIPKDKQCHECEFFKLRDFENLFFRFIPRCYKLVFSTVNFTYKS